MFLAELVGPPKTDFLGSLLHGSSTGLLGSCLVLVRSFLAGLRMGFLQGTHALVVGQLYSVQYNGIFGAPDKVRRQMFEEARPLRLDFQRDEVKIHHIITSRQDCWS